MTGNVGYVLFDADCRLCSRLARRLQPTLAARGFAVAPLQGRMPPNVNGTFAEMVVQTADGRAFGGADGVVYLSRFYWWAAPLRWLARLPGGLRWLRAGYAWVARHRPCGGGACPVDRHRPVTAGVPGRKRRNRHGASAFFEMP